MMPDFIANFWDNFKKGVAEDKEMQKNIKEVKENTYENMRKFQEQKKNLENSQNLKDARQKFEKIMEETEKVKTSSRLKDGISGIKDKVVETTEELGKNETVKKVVDQNGTNCIVE